MHAWQNLKIPRNWNKMMCAMSAQKCRKEFSKKMVHLFFCLFVFFFYVRSIVPISVTRFVGHSLSNIHFHFEPWKVVHIRIINHWVVNNTWPLAWPLRLCLFSVCKVAPGVSRRTWEELKRHQRILKNSTSSGKKRTRKNEIINLPYSLTSNCTDVL